MQNFVSFVNNENYEQFIERDPQKNKVILFTERKTTAPLFKSLSKTYKDKLLFGEVKKSDEELLKKFGVTETPKLLVITDPYNYVGEVYDSNEMKIDQLKKFLSNFAYSTPKMEKKVEFNLLTMKKAANPNTGVCGRKTSNLCVILFLKDKSMPKIIEQYFPLLDQLKSDPVTFAYVFSEDEPHMVKQFGITNNSGAVIYRPKRAKYTKLSDDLISNGVIPIDAVKKLVDDTLTGGHLTWAKVVNENNNGLVFKEWAD